MTTNTYTSVFAHDIEDFLTYKASCGIVNATRAWTMHKFDEYCAANNVAVFDEKAVKGWMDEIHDANRSESSYRLSYIKDFAKYLSIVKEQDVYIPRDDYGYRYKPSAPYLMEEDEIEAFFEQAKLYRPASPWAWQTIPFFGLMCVCGLRTGEVRRLSCEDVNFGEGFIDIKESKAHRSRRLPVTDEVRGMLYDCDKKSSKEFGRCRQAFFVSRTGRPVDAHVAGRIFGQIWSDAGLPLIKVGARVRPYDFRHHFAYANIERWQREGIDVESKIPFLALYMGHAVYQSTYYYTHLSPGFITEYAGSPYTTDNLLPEVGFDE